MVDQKSKLRSKFSPKNGKRQYFCFLRYRVSVLHNNRLPEKVDLLHSKLTVQRGIGMVLLCLVHNCKYKLENRIALLYLRQSSVFCAVNPIDMKEILSLLLA
jgi:hypothetical protein